MTPEILSKMPDLDNKLPKMMRCIARNQHTRPSHPTHPNIPSSKKLTFPIPTPTGKQPKPKNQSTPTTKRWDGTPPHTPILIKKRKHNSARLPLFFKKATK